MGAAESTDRSAPDFNYAADEQEKHFLPGDPLPGKALRLLCLHGHGSNNDITRLQINNLRLHEHGVVCDLLEATKETGAQNEMLELLSAGPFYTWFDFLGTIARSAMPFTEHQHRSASLQAALKRVMWYVKQNGPYDGVFGFSQGALLVSTLSSPECWRGLFGLEACPWKFCICACAGGTRFLKGLKLDQAGGQSSVTIATPICLPALHLIGKVDFWHRGSSEVLAKDYYAAGDGDIYMHAHGHELPMMLEDDAQLKAKLASFLQQCERPTTPNTTPSVSAHPRLEALFPPPARRFGAAPTFQPLPPGKMRAIAAADTYL